MEGKKPYLVVILVNAIYAGMFLLTEAAFVGGMNTFVFVFYRQAFATVFLAPAALLLEWRRFTVPSCMTLLKIFMLSLVGLNVYNVGLNYTTATVASAACNSIPVTTFILAVLLGMERLDLKRLPGVAKLLGVGMCFGGVMLIAFYTGSTFKPHLLHLQSFAAHRAADGRRSASGLEWVKGTFLLIVSNFTWSLWMVLQGKVLAEYPSKLVFTTLQCLFSAIQSFFVAVAVVRDFSKWKLSLDIGLLAVLYCGFVVTGISFYLQAWCIEKKGPVFLAISMPLTLVFTISVSTVLGEAVIMGSFLGALLMIGGLYNVMWGKSREQMESEKLPVAQNETESLEETRSEMASPFHPL